MKVNLSLSFWEFDGSIDEIETIEKDIIQKLVPILNLKNNRSNPWNKEIKILRKICVDLAKQNRI